MADDCCLVVSELIGNAVRHAVPGGGLAVCRLVLKLFADAVVVEVWDPSPDAGLRPCEEDVFAESGRGLTIVAALCGAPPVVFSTPGEGKTVVAFLARGYEGG